MRKEHQRHISLATANITVVLIQISRLQGFEWYLRDDISAGGIRNRRRRQSFPITSQHIRVIGAFEPEIKQSLILRYIYQLKARQHRQRPTGPDARRNNSRTGGVLDTGICAESSRHPGSCSLRPSPRKHQRCESVSYKVYHLSPGRAVQGRRGAGN
ncbi:hypothetical protein DL98DRAFT_304024 [Cadophora sp. DSE1049]|nr:hypothetical protein DL98DRAFT_304024 [Cadophora sp. DSE1049]